ncbi:doubled CXXCH motif [bacterium BMS3Bbin06]|nr:doubled CXXCH motif [bacterium BMS3Bbin06]
MGNGRVRDFRSFALILVFFASVFIFFFYFAGRHGVADAKTTASCVTSKCHSKLGKDKFVHGPVAVGECKVCHKPIAKHKFKPIKKVSRLCYQCHDKKNTMKHVHPPVKEGMCTSCHSPHQSPYKYQLYNKPPKLCFMCHDEKMVKGKFVHGPVAVGGCVICHNPHESKYPKMLMAAGNNVCFTCHTDKASAFKTAKFIHKPVRESCVNCHSPHATNYKYQLKADGRMDLCLGCHKDKKKWIATVKTKHGALEEKKKCLACHDPHFSKYPKQLVKQPMALCLSCHNKRIKATDNTMLPDMKAYLAKYKGWHGPIKQKDCAACHNPHGSDNFRILRKYFPPLFYAPFAVKNYALCFMCHEKTLVLTPKTTTLTGFRNGDQNLHYVHVNKPVKGRTCIACHEPHATNNPFHIRDTVPFGAWALPIGFKETKNGGYCTPGCHVTRYFNKIKAVKNR